MKLLNSVTFRLFKRDGVYVVYHRENDVSFPLYEAIGIPVAAYAAFMSGSMLGAWFAGLCLGALVYSLVVWFADRRP